MAHDNLIIIIFFLILTFHGMISKTKFGKYA